jgi:hypothetical protein
MLQVLNLKMQEYWTVRCSKPVSHIQHISQLTMKGITFFSLASLITLVVRIVFLRRHKRVPLYNLLSSLGGGDVMEEHGLIFSPIALQFVVFVIVVRIL